MMRPNGLIIRDGLSVLGIELRAWGVIRRWDRGLNQITGEVRKMWREKEEKRKEKRRETRAQTSPVVCHPRGNVITARIVGNVPAAGGARISAL